jgi:hypothetical protein
VEADRGRVALQRGPIVYAAEWPDNPKGKVRNIVLPDTASLTSEFRPDLLNGVQIIRGRASALAYDPRGSVTKTEQDFLAIPYATWANRGPGQMTVWLARSDAAAKPTPWPTIATTSTVTTSVPDNSPRGINDGEEPASSNDHTSYFDWWPRKGTTEWAEYAFSQPATVSAVDVYWFQDAPHGQTRVPASWRVLYMDGSEWRPVDTRDEYGTAPDKYNSISFTPVTTSGLRLEIVLQSGWSAGVEEWKVR